MISDYPRGFGSGPNGELTFLDWLAIFSFFLMMANYDENLSQSDKQDLQRDLSSEMNFVLNEVHSHLQEQDDKLDIIIKELKNDNRRSI